MRAAIMAGPILALSLLAATVAAQINNRYDDPLPSDLAAELKRRMEAVGGGLNESNREWAGFYLNYDHHSEYFAWAPVAGFVAWGSNHTFAPSAMNYGDAYFIDNRLILFPKIGRLNKFYQPIPKVFVPVRWDQQRFLIPSESLVRFAWDVHSGAESELNEYFRKSETVELKRRGLPGLPYGLRRIMTRGALRPLITSVSETKWGVLVRLDRGENAGIVEGMTLFAGTGRRGMSFFVTNLSADWSEAESSGVWTDSDEKYRVRKGKRQSSKAPRGFFSDW